MTIVLFVSGGDRTQHSLIEKDFLPGRRIIKVVL